MVTQKANLMNLVTPVQKTPNTEISGGSLTESFQSYVAGSNASFGNDVSRTTQMPQANATDSNHKEVYEAQKAAKDSYSMSKDTKTEDVEDGTETVKLDEVSEETLKDMKSAIREELKKVLGVTDEELDQLLAQADVSVLMMLNPEDLQKFVLLATDSEPVDLLTDTELTTTLREVADVVKNVAETFNVETDGDLSEIDFDALEAKLIETDEKTVAPKEAETNVQERILPDEKPEVIGETKPNTTKAPEEKKETTEAVKNFEDGFSVKEEETGIKVEVHKEKGSTDHSAGKEQNPQGVAQQVVHQLDQAIGNTEISQTASYASQTESIEIVRQVIEQIRITTGNGLDKLEMQLYPQHLGRIQLQVMMKNGIMTAQINAETEAAKNAIESQLQALKETFEAKGTKVEAIEVNVNTAAFDENRDKEGRDKTTDSEDRRGNRGRRGIRLDESGMPIDEITEEEVGTVEKMQAEGASVEYLA